MINESAKSRINIFLASAYVCTRLAVAGSVAGLIIDWFDVYFHPDVAPLSPINQHFFGSVISVAIAMVCLSVVVLWGTWVTRQRIKR